MCESSGQSYPGTKLVQLPGESTINAGKLPCTCTRVGILPERIGQLFRLPARFLLFFIIMTDNPKAMVPKSGGGSGPNTEQGAQPAENVRKQINKNRKPGMSAVLAVVLETSM